MFAKNKGLPINQNCLRYSTRTYPNKETESYIFNFPYAHRSKSPAIKGSLYNYGIEGGYYTGVLGNMTLFSTNLVSKVIDNIAVDGEPRVAYTLLDYTAPQFSYLYFKNFIFDQHTPIGTRLYIEFISSNYQYVGVKNGINASVNNNGTFIPSGFIYIDKTSYGVSIGQYNVFDKIATDPVKVICSSYVPFFYCTDSGNGATPLGINNIDTNYRRR